MYAIIEKDLANNFAFTDDVIDYRLSEDSIAVIITQLDFNRVLTKVRQVLINRGMSSELAKPVRSEISGLVTLLSPCIFNLSTVGAILSGESKASSLYFEIMDTGEQFSDDDFGQQQLPLNDADTIQGVDGEENGGPTGTIMDDIINNQANVDGPPDDAIGAVDGIRWVQYADDDLPETQASPEAANADFDRILASATAEEFVGADEITDNDVIENDDDNDVDTNGGVAHNAEANDTVTQVATFTVDGDAGDNFIFHNIDEAFSQENEQQHLGADTQIDEQQPQPNDAPVEVKPEPEPIDYEAQVRLNVKNFLNDMSYNESLRIPDDSNIYVTFDAKSNIDADVCYLGFLENINRMCKESGIFVLIKSSNYDRIDELIKKHDLIGKMFVVITSHSADCVRRELSQPVCLLGDKTKYIYTVKHRIDEDLQTLNHDCGITPEDRQSRIDEVIKGGNRVSHSKYDCVYIDHVSNVTYAIRQKGRINCLIYNARIDLRRKVITEIISRLCNNSVTDAKARCIALYEDQKKLSETNFVDYIVKKSGLCISDTQSKLNAAVKEYERQMKNIMSLSQDIAELRSKLNMMREGQDVDVARSRAFEEYHAILGLRKVASVEIVDSILNVYTNTIFCKDERTGRTHEMGTFHISIVMDNKLYAERSTINIKNTKHFIYAFEEGMNAPHVFSDGHICHGSLLHGVTQSYAKSDFYSVVLQIILFLQSANTSDGAGKYVNRWPMVDDEYIKDVEEKEVKGAIKIVEDKGKKDEFDDILINSLQTFSGGSVDSNTQLRIEAAICTGGSDVYGGLD